MKAAAYLRNRSDLAAHDVASHLGLAERIAALRNLPFLGEHADAAALGPLYLVPADTIPTLDTARLLNIAGERDFFGGVVPHPFVATKAITQPLVERDAAAPFGWSHAFHTHVADAVLAGFTAFTLPDATQAGRRILEGRGPVRVKRVRGIGGRGQIVAADAGALDAALAEIPDSELASAGLVIEENLTDVTTISVGRVRVGDLVAAYWGRQRLTPDNRGDLVYGGSTLHVARGDLSALLGIDPPEKIGVAIEQARRYDSVIGASYPGAFASRRNYDVAQGFDGRGSWKSGVLEQSWRMGGATGAEIAALEAFRADPGLCSITASTVEVYGSDASPPPGATIYFHGVDPSLGPMLKYSVLGEP